MEGGGDGGAAAAAAAPSTAPPRGASRAVLLEQRKKEVEDVAVVGNLVKVAYAEAWTTRAGAAMSSGYGKQVPKKKLVRRCNQGLCCHLCGVMPGCKGRIFVRNSKTSGLIFSMIIPQSKSLRVKKCLALFVPKWRSAAA